MTPDTPIFSLSHAGIVIGRVMHGHTIILTPVEVQV
jgi:hypothetical protein